MAGTRARAAIIAIGPVTVAGSTVLPGQAAVLTDLSRQDQQPTPTTSRPAMHTGLFTLLWVAVTVLMVVRPGSTTGV